MNHSPMDVTDELPAAQRAASRDLVLGRYRLGARLGAGGFGTVYAARDERLGRPVAVKAIPADGPAPERVRREAMAAARLEHPGVVAVFDVGDEGDARYLVSELVEGRTLHRLEVDGELSDRDVLRVGLALADALAHAHARGVVHRDVKPQNVIVPDEPRDPRGVAKLADFGVAHLADDEPLTRTGDVVGTLAYMAPEQAAGRPAGPPADLYSLALVLYEALAGANPVRVGSPAATARRVGSRLPTLHDARPDLPDELCAALDRALLPDPDERGTLAELADALARALPAVSDEGGTVAPLPLERAVRIPRWLARVGAGALAGGLLAAACVAAGRPPALPALAAAVAVAALPRVAWLATVTAAVALLAPAHPGAAILAAAAAAPVPLLLRRAGGGWSLPAVAPALGLLGLAGAYPALAGRAAGTARRAALGAIGAWWTLLASHALGRALLAAPAPPPAAATAAAARHALADTVASGALAYAAAWAVAAAVLPWLVGGRRLTLDVAGAVIWATALASAMGTIGRWQGAGKPGGLMAGALLAGAAALALRNLKST